MLRPHRRRPACALGAGAIKLELNHFHDLEAVAQAIDAREILTQIERIEGAIATDPALAIGTAKELDESCCETILTARWAAVGRNADLPPQRPTSSTTRKRASPLIIRA